MNSFFGSSAEDDFEFIQQTMDTFDRDVTSGGNDFFGIGNGNSAESRQPEEGALGEGEMEQESREQHHFISDKDGSPHEGVESNGKHTEGRGESHDIKPLDVRQLSPRHPGSPKQFRRQGDSGQAEEDEDITRDEEADFASSSESREEEDGQGSEHMEDQDQEMHDQEMQGEDDYEVHEEVEEDGEGEKGTEHEEGAQGASADARRPSGVPLHLQKSMALRIPEWTTAEPREVTQVDLNGNLTGESKKALEHSQEVKTKAGQCLGNNSPGAIIDNPRLFPNGSLPPELGNPLILPGSFPFLSDNDVAYLLQEEPVPTVKPDRPEFDVSDLLLTSPEHPKRSSITVPVVSRRHQLVASMEASRQTALPPKGSEFAGLPPHLRACAPQDSTRKPKLMQTPPSAIQMENLTPPPLQEGMQANAAVPQAQQCRQRFANDSAPARPTLIPRSSCPPLNVLPVVPNNRRKDAKIRRVGAKSLRIENVPMKGKAYNDPREQTCDAVARGISAANAGKLVLKPNGRRARVIKIPRPTSAQVRFPAPSFPPAPKSIAAVPTAPLGPEELLRRIKSQRGQAGSSESHTQLLDLLGRIENRSRDKEGVITKARDSSPHNAAGSVEAPVLAKESGKTPTTVSELAHRGVPGEGSEWSQSPRRLSASCAVESGTPLALTTRKSDKKVRISYYITLIADALPSFLPCEL